MSFFTLFSGRLDVLRRAKRRAGKTSSSSSEEVCSQLSYFYLHRPGDREVKCHSPARGDRGRHGHSKTCTPRASKCLPRPFFEELDL